MITFRKAVKMTKPGEGPERPVLAGVTAQFPRGRSVAVFGADRIVNSALVALISGADRLDAGSIRVDGEISWPLGYRASGSGGMTPRDAATFVARLYGRDPDEVADFVSDFAEVRRGLDRQMGSYSPDVRRRIHISLSLALDFDAYLVEGAIGGGEGFRDKCWDFLHAKQEDGAQIILVTDRVQHARTVCEAGAVLDRGDLVIYDDIRDAAEAFGPLAGRSPRKSRDKGERAVP